MIFLILLLVSQNVLAKKEKGPMNSFRIVGGRTTEIEEFPFMVFLSGPQRDNRKSRQCGGSILSTKWAITAAHCYEGVIVEQMCFLAGTSSTISGGSYHCTENYYPHEKYNLLYVPQKNVRTSEYDIAVVEVTPHFPLDGVRVAAIPLPPDDLEPPPGMNGTVLGWGKLEEKGMSSSVLRSAEIVIISRKECQQWYPYYYVSDQHICARHPDQWKGFCRGDSGGPLVAGGFLMGIASWTDRDCGDPTKPNVFAFVPYFREWIYKMTDL